MPKFSDVKEAKPYLQKAYENVLLKARDLNARSVALPLLSSGIFGYPPAAAAQDALEVCKDPRFKDLDIVFYTGDANGAAFKELTHEKEHLK